MPSLMDKLRMLDAAASKPVAPKSDEPPASTDCYRTSERFPLSSFCELRHATAPILNEIFGIEFPLHVQPQDMLFLDTETTGLSGGAGTIAFEVGIGYFSGGHFVVEQFCMRDYPEEAFLLNDLKPFLERFPVLVTFNGRTFDVPLLKNRLLMNRMSDQCVSECHADVLHASRRVWKLRLGRCTLQKLEEAVLGIERVDDLPGELVPQTFFRFLKNGDFAPIERILDHNRQDIVSLAQLLFFLCKLYDRPETVDEPLDLLSLAKAVQKRGDSAKAKKCFRMGAVGSRRAESFDALAKLEKREGNAASAARLYAAMLKRGDDPVNACEGLAKLYEHQLGSVEQALVYTRQALLLLSEPRLHQDDTVQAQRNALQYRYARLRRKLATNAQA